ncbi:polynucleotide 5'-hydroxyl-kinase NOL9 isoform X1 [Colletes gigas]|uniref:polynucleotide 5'-hydroxyl-kinase NOL9 isoform X1 n=2 Tax=Colletes gigas TaxID=935657 RepID=UPI001C9B7533|nr:polynucleotide 5'-hydroxyl-kinase NOL9 isoform X1 [Colletes gigas]
MKKTTQTKKAKTKVVKRGTKQIKFTLSQYKTKSKLVKGRRKSFLKCLSMYSQSTKTKNDCGPSSSARSLRDKQLPSQSGVNRKKKKSPTTVKGSAAKAKDSMDFSSKLSDDSRDARSARDKDRKKYCNSTKEQRNLGSPVVVETFLESISSLNIPKILTQNQIAKMENNSCNYNLSYTQSISSQKNETSIIVAQSLNPNSIPGSSKKVTKRTSLSKNNCKQWKNKAPLEDVNVNVTDSAWDFNERTLVQCLENIRFDTMDEDSSILKAKTVPAIMKKKRNSILDEQCQLQFFCLKNRVVVVMPEKTKLCFTGKLVLKVLHGAVEVFGYLITTESKPAEIYSPRGYSSVSIQTSQKFLRDNQPDIWSLLNAEGITRDTRNKLVEVIENIQSGTTVILLSILKNELTKFLSDFYPYKLFPKIQNISYQSWTDPKRAEVILQSHLYVDRYPFKELIVDQCVMQDLSENMLNRWLANEWSCTLIAGGKNVGKSTTTRCLINSLLPVSKMAVLVDVDVGQTECTPPGCISYSLIETPLMGPNFTHLITPVFQLYIGDVQVVPCITRYMEGMKMMIEKLKSCPVLSRLPIVVNTMGFTRFIGWDIILFTIKLIQPTLVVQITSENAKNNYVGFLNKETINNQVHPPASWSRDIIDYSRPCDHELYVVNSMAERQNFAKNETRSMEPYQQRELVMVSYLSRIMRSPMNSISYYDAVSSGINDAVPYMIPFSSLFISIPRAYVSPTHVLNVVNGNIVALCGFDEEGDESQPIVPSNLRVLNKAPLCTCYGFGIVRGVDMEREEIFISTPLPLSTMQHVNCLTGCVPVPSALLQLNQHRNAPYTGENDVLPTSREPRRGYFRMRPQVQNNS